MCDGDEDSSNGSDYDRGSSDESRRSEIEQNVEESDGQFSDEDDEEADVNQDEGPALNQGGRLAGVRERIDDDDDEITDSRGGDQKQDILKALTRLANEINQTVKELRAEQKGKSFEHPHPTERKTISQRQKSEYSDGDESQSACSQRSLTPRKKESSCAMDYYQAIDDERGSLEGTGIFHLCSMGTRRNCERWPLRMDEF